VVYARSKNQESRTGYLHKSYPESQLFGQLILPTRFFFQVTCQTEFLYKIMKIQLVYHFSSGSGQHLIKFRHAMQFLFDLFPDQQISQDRFLFL